MRLAAMYSGVAYYAERDQVLFGIGPRLAAKLFVVNLKIGHRAARLASPVVPTEHPIVKLLVGVRIQAQMFVFRSDPVHRAFSIA